MRQLPTITLVLAVMAGTICLSYTIRAQQQPFVHPGIDQNAKDLAQMKKLVLAGEQPYKTAYDKLKAATDTSFTVQAHTHVLRGPYGRPNIGGNDLSKSAEMAYNNALVWYITNDKKYAAKAIDIINAWPPVLWHFDYNDAKLLAGWTGHQLINAAEILRYTHAGWQQKDIDAFTEMLMTVYYPLMRYYYPQANGNWDGAIIHSIMAIGIFTDNRKMFNNAVDHFLHAPVNGSLFKYIYPNGQCQESRRDQGHVQLGLGEFAGAAQVAYTQGVDLYAAGNNRLALGYEYTASFLLGEKPYCYGGPISERAKGWRDDYESVYRHYTAMGVDMPYTKRAADSARVKASRSVLTSVRAPLGKPVVKQGAPKISIVGNIAGAGAATAASFPADAVVVELGQNIQQALDGVAGSGRTVVLKAGIHTLPGTLKMPSGVTLAGEGLSTVLFLNPSADARETIVNAADDMHDVTIRDLVIECGTKTETPSDPNSARSYRGGYNRGGILIRALTPGSMKNLRLMNLTVQNGTYNGIFLSGVEKVQITRCDVSENGVSVAPGQKLMHNILLTHCKDVAVVDCRLGTSALGAGIAIEKCKDVSVARCEIARNGYYGVDVIESNGISITGNLIEANDRSGVMIEYQYRGNERVTVSNNTIQYNNGYGVEAYAAKALSTTGNKLVGNGNAAAAQQKVSVEKVVVME